MNDEGPTGPRKARPTRRHGTAPLRHHTKTTTQQHNSASHRTHTNYHAKSGLTHLQFRRFAGCPVCNLHLRSISGRIEEINTAGIREVVVFHSTAAELRKYQDDMPFAVVGDPDKDLYRRFGVEASTKALRLAAWRALPGGYWHAIKTAIAKRRSPLPASPTNGNLGLPADLLIGPDGRILAAKYGSHAYDQWTVDEILATARQQ
ncbi:AhpC/TSA family protein [Mycobacteroides abscessus subsp. abscessus]|nr:AhpC/TSA family protein [Mycobacteroides abscessus subsp. abscessus]